MRKPLAASLAVPLLIAACGTADDDGGSPAASGGATKVKLQLQWFAQAQFAGYIAARGPGLLQGAGAGRADPRGRGGHRAADRARPGQADYAVAWVPKALASREQGARDH